MTQLLVCRCGPRRFVADAGRRSAKSDPTGTSPLQRKWNKELTRRWTSIKRLVPDMLTKLADPVGMVAHTAATGDDRVRAFGKWLDEAMNQIVLARTGAWMLPYVRAAADTGLQHARSSAEALSPSQSTTTAGDRTPIVQSLVIEELQGIMDAVSQQLTRVFAQGLLFGTRPPMLLRNINSIIDSVGVKRSTMLTNFFTVRAFNVSALDHYRAVGITHVGTVPEKLAPAPGISIVHDAKKKKKTKSGQTKAERAQRKLERQFGGGPVDVLTAGDDNVCDECQEISDEGPYDLDTAEALIPAHPNCRCAFVPADSDVNDASYNPDGDPHPITGAGVLVRADNTGRVLFMHHKERDQWEFPAGTVEAGETAHQTAHREMQEETGHSLDFYSLQEHDRNADHGVDFTTFHADVPLEFKPQLSHEHDAYHWAYPASPPRPLHPGVHQTLLNKVISDGNEDEPRDDHGRWTAGGGVSVNSVDKNDIAKIAQQHYDEWTQDEDGSDEELGGGGICDRIASDVGGHLAGLGVETADGGQDGDDHAYVIANFKEGVHAVDIPPGVYEHGAGYSWTKKQGVKIGPQHVVIHKIDGPMSDKEFARKYGDDSYTGDEFNPDEPRDEHGMWTSIGGADFKSFTPPDDWNKVQGQNHSIDEPPLPQLKTRSYKNSKGETVQGKDRIASGVIMREPDGRVWLVKPTNGFGGYKWTFPKGGVEEGMHPQANAIKETFEETGLKARITGWAGDYKGDTGITRMYYAVREGGHPKDKGWETEQVALAHPDDLPHMLNRSRDRKIAEHHLGVDMTPPKPANPNDVAGKVLYRGGGDGKNPIGTYLTTDKKWAAGYGPVTAHLVDPKAKIFDLDHPGAHKVWGKGWWHGGQPTTGDKMGLFSQAGAQGDYDALRPEIHENIKKAGFHGIAWKEGMGPGHTRVFMYPGHTKQVTADEFNPDEPRDEHGRWTSSGASGFSKTLTEAGIPHEIVHSTEEGVVIKVKNEHDLPSLEAIAASHGDFKHKGTGIAAKYYTFASIKTPTSTEQPLKMSDLDKVSGKEGSNEGGTYEVHSSGENPNWGKQFYIKQPKSADHVTNELLAAKLYKLAGVPTFNYVPVEGGKHVATEKEDLAKKNVSQLSPVERKVAQQDFAVHAWLANWDAAGTGGDNIGVRKNGAVVTLDTGGALKYRAQGEPKGAAFGNEVNETNTLRDPQKNPDAAALYGSMTNSEIVQSINKVTAINNDDIRKIVYKHDVNTTSPEEREAMVQKLIARKNDLAKQAIKMVAADPHATPYPGFKTTGDLPAPAPKSQTVLGPNTNEKATPPAFKNKMEHAKHLLMKGTTTKEITTTLGWKSMNIPGTAEKLGLKLTKTKVDGVFHYKGEPLNPGEASGYVPGPTPAKTFGKKGVVTEATPEQIQQAHAVLDKPKLIMNGANTPLINFTDTLKENGIGFTHTDLGDKHEIALYSTTHVDKVKAITANSFFKYTVTPATSDGTVYHVFKVQTKPGSPFSNTKLSLTPEPAKYDINTPEGNFAQSLLEHGIPFTTKTLTSGKPVVNVDATHHEQAAQVAKWHPQAELLGSGGGSYIFHGTGGSSSFDTPDVKPSHMAFQKALEKAGVFSNISPHNLDDDKLQISSPTTFKEKMAEIAKAHPQWTLIKGNVATYEANKAEFSDEPGVLTNATPSHTETLPKTVLGPVSTSPPTPAELEKAKKNVPLQMQYIPGAKPELVGGEPHTMALAQIEAFNKAYAGKTLTNEPDLEIKVAAFKNLTAQVNALAAKENGAKAAIAQQAAVTQKQKAEQLAAKQAEEAAKAKAEFEAKMNDPAVKAQYDSLHSIGVSSKASLDKEYASYIKKMADKGHPITGADAAYIVAYRGSAYDNLNEQLWQNEKINLKQAIYANAFEKALDKMPNYEGYGQRGIHDKDGSKFARYAKNVGHVVNELGFSSYGAKHKLWGDTILHMQLKNGRDIRTFNPGEGGGEIILQRNTLLHITKVDPKTREVWGEEV